MEITLNDNQFSESFIEMTAQLDFDIQNYIASLLTPQSDTLFSFELHKSQKGTLVTESAY